MARKTVFQKQDVIQGAINLVRKRGIDSCTARGVAISLGMSTQPIFSYFESMDELKREVYDYAKGLYQNYITDGLKQSIPFLGVGKQFIRFAIDEPEFYKLLFLTAPQAAFPGPSEGLRFSQNLARASLMNIYHMNEEDADYYFRDLWLAVYSFANLIVTKSCPFSESEMSRILSEISLATYKAYKEVPGFFKGEFNKDAIFKELVKK